VALAALAAAFCYWQKLLADEFLRDRAAALAMVPRRKVSETPAAYQRRLQTSVEPRFYEADVAVHAWEKLLNWLGPWHTHYVWPAVFVLDRERRVCLHGGRNIIHVDNASSVDSKQRASDALRLRTAVPATGDFFGRNCPAAEQTRVAVPPVGLVVEKLLRRRPTGLQQTHFKSAGDQLNVLAAAWIQLNVHDWMGHLLLEWKEPSLVRPCAHAAPFAATAFRCGASVSTRTSWWDASSIYGQTAEDVAKARLGREGKVRSLRDADDRAVVGDQINTWLGVQLLQDLFLREHNYVCDLVRAAHPDWDDDRLFAAARLVVAAVIAKIHTVDWTTQLLKHPTLAISMNANWHGLLGERFKAIAGHTGSPELSGLVGLPTAEEHGVPFQMTEEFSAVYRHFHSMLPDELLVAGEKVEMADCIGVAPKALKRFAADAFWEALLRQPCGLPTLFNYPTFSRKLEVVDQEGQPTPEPVDLAVMDVYRDRERGVLRYNDFRRAFGMKPLQTWRELTKDPEALEALLEVYGDDVELLDLSVGCLAETKPPGFAISDTAFRVFVVMASRRIMCDDFYTSCYRSSVYSQTGLEHVAGVKGLSDLLRRHLPHLKLPGRSAFAPV
jgi:alpha-dioxygenase